MQSFRLQLQPDPIPRGSAHQERPTSRATYKLQTTLVIINIQNITYQESNLIVINKLVKERHYKLVHVYTNTFISKYTFLMWIT